MIKKKKRTKRNNYLQNTTHNYNDRVTECRDPGMYDTMKHLQMSKSMLLGMVVVAMLNTNAFELSKQIH
jgi:hypothetical protein